LKLGRRARLEEHDPIRFDLLERHEDDEPAHAPSHERERPLEPLGRVDDGRGVVVPRGGADLEILLQVDGLDLYAWERPYPVCEDPRPARRPVDEKQRGNGGQAGAGCCARR
jgi:hypothetical protein